MPETQSSSTHVNMPANVLYEILEDEAVILSLESEQYFTLDDIGTRMWQLLLEHHEPDIVVQKMLDEYEIDEESVRQDLDTLITQLIEHKLLIAKQ